MPQNSLEQEAMDRVRRMYSSFDSRRGNNPVRQPEQNIMNNSGNRAEKKPNTNENKEPIAGTAAEHEPPDKPNSILDVFMKDRDQSLILLLLALLMRDGADMNLMLALVYLLI